MTSTEPEGNLESDDDLEGNDPAGDQDAPVLTPGEARVLGSLLEKAQTTPEYYPLTMNALQAACNQKSNRTPVVNYTEQQVEEAVAGLRSKGFALRVSVAGSRVPKYQHTLERALPDLGPRETALLTVLLLRGQQTLGELKARAERLFHFASLEQAQESLDELEIYPARQLVKSIDAGGGRRVQTFVHLLCGTSGEDWSTVPDARVAPSEVAPDWHERIEEEVTALRTELTALRRELDEFRAQFG